MVVLPKPEAPIEDHVGCGLDKFQGHQLRNERLVTMLGPLPVEVCQGLEAPDVRGAHPALKRAAGTLLLFPTHQGLDPFGSGATRSSGSPARAASMLGRG